MIVRFFIDPETSRPHVENHGVVASECLDVLDRSEQDYASRDGTRVAAGPTRSGRLLKVVYKENDDGESVFVITAYTLRGTELRAYRRRLRRRR